MVIQTLATSFDLGERPLPLMGDVEAEDLWQQHDRVIKLLITRLRNEQQAKIQLQESYQDEMARRLEKETLIETLQVNLATQSSQLMELENAIEEQKPCCYSNRILPSRPWKDICLNLLGLSSLSGKRLI